MVEWLCRVPTETENLANCYRTDIEHDKIAKCHRISFLPDLVKSSVFPTNSVK